ncbi:MAG TPA: hypothetical protein VGN95_00820 [Pyrinomonadaceae bacterium]|jgi:hypothetical protein|nr:hypothetical protein [Pyrinomonadaceae bacterium]
MMREEHQPEDNFHPEIARKPNRIAPPRAAPLFHTQDMRVAAFVNQEAAS